MEAIDLSSFGLEAFEVEAARVFLSASRSIVGVARRRRNDDPRNCATGFLWDRKGTVVTNHLPFLHATEFNVFLSDGDRNRRGEGGVEYMRVGVDEARDIIVLRPVDVKAVISHRGFRQGIPLPRSSGADLRVGQSIYSIGNLFGMQKTFHGGILSGIGRNVNPPLSTRPLRNVLQTDVLDERGRLGSILLNSKAELVGIVSSLSSGVQGATFAVPVDEINDFVLAAISESAIREHRTSPSSGKNGIVPLPEQDKLVAPTAGALPPLFELPHRTIEASFQRLSSKL